MTGPERQEYDSLMKLTHTANKEWGSKARKEQEDLRGLTHADARRAIAEELATIAEIREAEMASGYVEMAVKRDWGLPKNYMQTHLCTIDHEDIDTLERWASALSNCLTYYTVEALRVLP